MSTATLPGPIHTKLSGARFRLRAVDLALGLARAILASSIVLLVLFMLDTTLEPPLPVLRGFALFMGLLAAAASTVFLSKPVRRPLTDDDVALLVEQEHPDLRDALVSTVQLSRQLDAPDLYTSRALIRSTIDRTARQVEEVDFGRVVRTGPLVPLWVMIAAFLGLGFLLMQNPKVREYADTFYRRVVLGDRMALYPKLVKLTVLLEPDVAVAKGDDLTVDVRIDDGAHLLNKLTVWTRFADGTTEEREVRSADSLIYRKSYQNITDGFSFWIADDLHDVATPVYNVRVVQRPRVERYEFILEYPEYTGKPTEAVTQPDLSVPTGTKVTYLIVANKALDQAELRFEYERKAATKRGQAEAEPAPTEKGPAPAFLGDLGAGAFASGGAWESLAAPLGRQGVNPSDDGRRVLVGQFRVSKDVRFHYWLLSTEPDGRGYDNGKKPVVFTITALADQRPVVNIPVPGRRKQVTPQAKLPLVIDVREDYGIQSLELRYRVQRPDEAQPRAQEKLALPLPPGAASQKQLKVEAVLDIADLRLQPNDQLIYVAAATDHNVDEALRTAESRQFEVQVVRPEDLERILQDRLQALKERLEAAAREETEVKTATQTFVGELGPKDVLTDDDKRRLQRLEQDQRRVTTRVEDVLDELLDIGNERKLNRLDDEAASSLVAELSSALREVAKDRAPAISRELDDARGVTRLDDRVRSKLSRVPDLQQKLAEDLMALAARIAKWGDFTEVIQELRDLQRGQDRVIEGTQKAVETQHR